MYQLITFLLPALKRDPKLNINSTAVFDTSLTKLHITSNSSANKAFTGATAASINPHRRTLKYLFWHEKNHILLQLISIFFF